MILDFIHGRHRRRERLAAIMQNSGCDVIGLQECSLSHWEYYKEQLKAQYDTHAKASDSETAGETCAIFWNKDRFIDARPATFWLNDTMTPYKKIENAKRIRLCSWVELTDTANNNQTIRIYNTHFDHAKDDTGDEVKDSSAQVILSEMDQHGTKHCVLMGDLNCHPHDLAYETLSLTMVDCWLATSRRTSVWPATYHGWSAEKGCCIDYIFCSKDWNIHTYRVGGDIKTVTSKYPSDHFPIFADLSCKPQPGNPPPVS